MGLEITTVLGFAAAVLTTSAFFPQVVQTWRTRSAKDLNLKMFLLLTVGIFLWLVYGIAIGEWPVIVANTVGLLSSLTMLVFKIRYG
ncbi:MAG: SemiSWEET family sugar transporter [Planctomycetota bacterium]|jgi:MtN3 and saliva related transmembrane protein